MEVGANTCIDRSTMGSTYLRKGVKLDNLVQIAHNVEVGAHTVMSAKWALLVQQKLDSGACLADKWVSLGISTLVTRCSSGHNRVYLVA